MYVQQLGLACFRNFGQVDVKLPAGFIQIQGRNQAGKTSFLESLYLLSTLTSFRARQLSECIQFHHKFFNIRAEIYKESSLRTLDFSYLFQGKRLFHSFGKKIEPVYRAVGILRTLYFSPLDIDLVLGMPARRRRLMNEIIGQTDPVYLYHLKQYRHVLRQRNALLRNQNGCSSREISIWNEPLSQSAIYIRNKRREWVDEINFYFSELYTLLGRENEVVQIKYQASPGQDVNNLEAYRSVLTANEKNDIIQGRTLNGPQRDELGIQSSSQDLQKYGSMGQVRLFVILWKLASWKYMAKTEKDTPVLLLDDILVELDPEGQEQVIKLISKLHPEQVISTTTRDQHIFPETSRFIMTRNASKESMLIPQE